MKTETSKILIRLFYLLLGFLVGVILNGYVLSDEIGFLESNVTKLEGQRDILIQGISEKHREVHDLNQMINRFIEADGGHVLMLPDQDEFWLGK